MVRYRLSPAAASPADAVIVSAIDAAVEADQERGRQVTGSMRCPAMLAPPMAPAMPAARARPPAARCDASTAAAGMTHGGAIPAPQPTARAVGTGSGTPIPSGSPGTSSRTATRLLIAAAPA
jgi:hypothetical protein